MLVRTTVIRVIAKFAPLPFYPVGLVFVLIVVTAALIMLKRRRFSLMTAIAAAATVYLFSTPLVSKALVRSLECRYNPFEQYPQASAILLLGGGAVAAKPPRIYPETNWFGDRIMHAARLYHKGFAPYIIPSGGRVGFLHDRPNTEAENNAWLLINEFGVDSSAILLEDKAKNTHDHASLLLKILADHDLSDTVLVVTSAVHMYRSVKVLEKAGFTVIPAPTDYHVNANERIGLITFMPSAYALAESTMALHEYYGLLAYKLLGWI